jgi:hypothetical protein
LSNFLGVVKEIEEMARTVYAFYALTATIDHGTDSERIRKAI